MRKKIYAKSYKQPRKRYIRQRRGFFAGVLSKFSDIYSAILSKIPVKKDVGTSPAPSANPVIASPVAPAPVVSGVAGASTVKNTKQFEKRSPWIRLLDFAVVAAILGAGVFLSYAFWYSDTSINVTFTQAGVTRNIKTKCETVKELLSTNGFELMEGDILNCDINELLTDGFDIYVIQAFPVAVASGDEVSILKMRGGSVGEALQLADINYGANDELTKLPFEDVEPGMHIQHISVEIKYETKDQVVGYKEQIIKDDTRYKGDDKIRVAGEDGEKRIVRRLIYHDGVLYSREIMNQLTLKEAVNQVKVVGTKIRYQTSLSGDTREWKAAPKSSEIRETMIATEVTAYTHTGRKTATGKWPRIGYVAVNPNIIPYGTKLYVPGYGYCTAQDTGAFRFEENGKKNQLDLFMNTEQECRKWGRKKNIKFYILK